MTYIKNISNTQLSIPDFGIVLQINEYRDLAEFANRQKIQDYSDILIDLLNDNKIILLDADLQQMIKSVAVKYICNAYDIIKVDTNLNNKFYYFLKDKFYLARNNIIEKYFKGRVKSLYMISDTTDIQVSIQCGNGLKMHDEIIIKRQTLEFDFNGDIEDITVSISIPESAGVKTSIDIFMDGYSSGDKIELQSFIDSWKENLSDYDIYSKSIIIESKNLVSNISNADNFNLSVLNINGNINDFICYKNNNTVIVEKHNNLKWNRFDRTFVKAKNVNSIKFDNGTLLVKNITKSITDHINEETI